MGVFNFSSSKIEITNLDMSMFLVPKNVTLLYMYAIPTVKNKLNFFIDGKAEISILNQSDINLSFSGTSEDVKLKLYNPNIESISVIGIKIEIEIFSFSPSSQIKEINLYSGSVTFSGSDFNNLNNIVVNMPNGLNNNGFIQGLNSSQYSIVYDLVDIHDDVYITNNVNYLKIVKKHNKLKSKLSKLKSLILLNNKIDNDSYNQLIIKLLLLNKEIENTKKLIKQYEDTVDY